MSALIVFFQGILCFLYPCMLHNIPVYLIYTASTSSGNAKGIRRFFSSLGFLSGLIILYTALGPLFQSVASLISANGRIIYIITGILMIFFALGFFGIKPFCFLHFHVHTDSTGNGNHNFFSALAFGLVCAASWVVCLLPFILPVLMSTAAGESALHGAFIMFSFSLGLSIPLFLLSMLINSSKKVMDFLHKNEKIISIITGIFILVIGILMVTGLNTRLDELFHHLTGTTHDHIA